MIVNDRSPRVQYTSLSGTVYAVPFEFYSVDDIEVYFDDNTVAETSGYTVAGAGTSDPPTGSVTFSVAPATSGATKMTIVRATLLERVTNFSVSGDWTPERVNSEFNRLIMMLQQVRLLLVNSVALPVTSAISGPVLLGDPVENAVVKWSSGALVPGPTTTELEAAEANAIIAAAKAAEALASAIAAAASAASIALPLAITSGGTGATSAAASRAALGVPATADVLPTDANQATYTDAHTLTASDKGKTIYVNKGSAVTLTCPQNTTEALGPGFQVTVVNLGAGQVTVAVEGADTLNKPTTKTAKLAEQMAIAVVWKRADGQWHVDGNLELV